MERILFYRVKVYVGPVWVEHYARQAREAGMTDILEGTEHIHGTLANSELKSEAARMVFQQRVANLVYGSPMAAGWRDVEILRAV